MSNNFGAILVLSGPSGAGKSTLLKEIINDIGECYFSISTTTRTIREGEENGRDYYFVKEEKFKQDMQEDMFLEHAYVHGNYYGTSLKPVQNALEDGKLVIFDIDVQGNAAIAQKLGDITTSVFISSPTLSDLKQRLQMRKTDTQEVINIRLKMARQEIQRIDEYDYLLINDDIQEAADILRTIAQAARLKKQAKNINEFSKKWEDID
ncbi:MAG: guanylate kinase [Sulfurimonas sp.]|nr:guanylate kinase [Sulfurimonas sp.]PHQ91960.1 MAG: guanylate kinase [Sulfurimonas sp.]